MPADLVGGALVGGFPDLPVRDATGLVARRFPFGPSRPELVAQDARGIGRLAEDAGPEDSPQEPREPPACPFGRRAGLPGVSHAR